MVGVSFCFFLFGGDSSRAGGSGGCWQRGSVLYSELKLEELLFRVTWRHVIFQKRWGVCQSQPWCVLIISVPLGDVLTVRVRVPSPGQYRCARISYTDVRRSNQLGNVRHFLPQVNATNAMGELGDVWWIWRRITSAFEGFCDLSNGVTVGRRLATK